MFPQGRAKMFHVSLPLCWPQVTRILDPTWCHIAPRTTHLTAWTQTSRGYVLFFPGNYRQYRCDMQGLPGVHVLARAQIEAG